MNRSKIVGATALASFMAAGAAATKQSGFFIAFLNFPAIIFWCQRFKFSISKIG